MKKYLFVMSLVAFMASTSGAVHAKGCLKGAAVGGVAGHVAGKHGAAGAAAGCAIGHHKAAKQEKQAQAAQAKTADRGNTKQPTSSGQ